MSAKLAGRNLALYILHFAFRAVSPVVVTPFLARTLGPGDYADYVLWNACVWTASLVMEFGFYLYAINATATAESEAALSRVVSSVVTAKLVLAPLAIAAFLAVAFALGLTAREPLAVCFGVVALFCYGASFAWYFQGLQRGGTAVLIDAVPVFAQFVFIFLLVDAPGQLWRVAAIQSSAPLISILVGVSLVFSLGIRVRLLWGDAVRAISKAVPYFLERAYFAIYSTAAPVIIAVIATKHEAGYYGIAEKVSVLLTALVFAATQALSPTVAVRARAAPPDWRLSLKIIAVVLLITLTGALLTATVLRPAVLFALGEEYSGVVPVAQAFCAVAVLMTFQLALSNFIIIPSGSAKMLIRSGAIALCVTLLLQFVLVPRHGALGAVIARGAGEFALGLYLLFGALRILRRDRSASMCEQPQPCARGGD